MGFAVVLLIVAAGCLEEGAEQATDASADKDDPAPGEVSNASGKTTVTAEAEEEASTQRLAFGDPIPLTPAEDDHGFEPSIVADGNGTLYLTANAGFRIHESHRLASWLWYSEDGGASWKPVESPAGVHETLYGIEGDIATDGLGRLYFVDMAGPDNTFSRWRSTATGPAWDFTRPIQGTLAPIDDRPWLAGHGDGIVYYMAFTGAAVEGDAQRTPGPQPGDPMWIHKSDDGGLTWSPGRSFPGALHCEPAASPADAGTVVVGCRPADGSEHARAWWSSDGGSSWTEKDLGSTGATPSPGFISADIGEEGRGVVAWPRDDPSDDSPGVVQIATGNASAPWRVEGISLGDRTVGSAWIDAGSPGVAAAAVYASPDVPVSESSPWFLHVLVTTELGGTNASWSHVKVTKDPVGRGEEAPPDFLQLTLSSSDRIHVAFQRTPPADDLPPGCCLTAYGSNAFVVNQQAGPNLDG